MRMLVAILVGLPMLVPQGVCICGFAPSEATPSKSAASTSQPSPGHSCCHPRVKPPAPPKDSPPNSGRHSHDSDCPCLRDLDLNKFVESVRVNAIPVEVFFEPLTVAATLPPSGGQDRAVPHSRHVGDPPLYVAFLTLVI